jgi:hypothetical protein
MRRHRARRSGITAVKRTILTKKKFAGWFVPVRPWLNLKGSGLEREALGVCDIDFDGWIRVCYLHIDGLVKRSFLY